VLEQDDKATNTTYGTWDGVNPSLGLGSFVGQEPLSGICWQATIFPLLAAAAVFGVGAFVEGRASSKRKNPTFNSSFNIASRLVNNSQLAA
jgi:hypothetical protein